ncbi:hypothetical protein [Geopseudomonas aromaticivorans]
MDARKEEFPSTVYRVTLNAELNPGLKVNVMSIPCRRTAKVFKTAHGKSIKQSEIMRPNSFVDRNLIMEYVYCDQEDQVSAAIDLLIARSRQKADAMLAKAMAIHEAAHSEPTIQRENWFDRH